MPENAIPPGSDLLRGFLEHALRQANDSCSKIRQPPSPVVGSIGEMNHQIDGQSSEDDSHDDAQKSKECLEWHSDYVCVGAFANAAVCPASGCARPAPVQLEAS